MTHDYHDDLDHGYTCSLGLKSTSQQTFGYRHAGSHTKSATEHVLISL